MVLEFLSDYASSKKIHTKISGEGKLKLEGGVPLPLYNPAVLYIQYVEGRIYIGTHIGTRRGGDMESILKAWSTKVLFSEDDQVLSIRGGENGG